MPLELVLAVIAVLACIGVIVALILWAEEKRALRRESDKLQVLEEATRQLRHVEESRKEFMDMVAHQLRTPLGGIRASASMLVNGDMGELPPKAREALVRVEEVSARLISLADTFLHASRIEVGVYKGQREATDVRAEVAGVVSELLPYATGKGLTVDHVEDAAFAHPVRLDREVLRNTLFNLLDNAIKYTEEGRISIRVHAKGDRLICDVADSGMGLTKEDIAQLFQKFQRVKGRRQEGLGLGLYVVKRLVDATGGTIRVTSEGPGKGSMFSFELPYEVDGGRADR